VQRFPLRPKIHEAQDCFLYHGATPLGGLGPPRYQGFTITFRHTTLGRTALDQWYMKAMRVKFTLSFFLTSIFRWRGAYL